MAAALEVVRLVHIAVGLALEGDGEIGAHRVAQPKEVVEPRHAVPEVEKHVEHLAHLARVDVFVPTLIGRHHRAVTHDDAPKEVDGVEAAWREVAAMQEHGGGYEVRPDG